MSSYLNIEPSKLLFRYIAALGLIVALVLGGHALHIATGKRGALDEEVLNISGRQRMLSQRIILLANRLNDTQDQRYRELLNSAVQRFEDSHFWIIDNAVVPGTEVHAHYFDPTGHHLDAGTKDFIAAARVVLGAVPASETKARAVYELEHLGLVDLLADLDSAVHLFEGAANARSDTLEKIQVFAVAATLLVLLLEVALIFYPAHRAILNLIQKLKFQAWHDQMTGLSNRNRVLARSREMLGKAPKDWECVAMMALDLDGFKQINDMLGHPVGDQVLQTVARRIEAVLEADGGPRDYVIGRMGGDEFLITIRHDKADLDRCTRDLGNRIIKEVSAAIEVTLEHGGTGECSVGVSVGYVLGELSDGELDLLASHADTALYESKRNGKGITTAFTPEMRVRKELDQERTDELKLGLQNLEFRTFFQPQIDLVTGKLDGVEALARWEHPDKGLLTASQFVELAEEARLVDALDGQIYFEAFEAFSQFRKDGINLGKLSLNASGRTLRDPDCCDLLVNVAALCEVSPSEVNFEVLENIVVGRGAQDIIETIRKLKAAGFGVLIDDFGVGYSSLSRVSDLEVTGIKIDRSLTLRSQDSAMTKVISATAAMAQGMNAKLYAEGIETQAQYEKMRELGVDIGQGFFWSRPLPMNEFKLWLADRQLHYPDGIGVLNAEQPNHVTNRGAATR